MIYVDKNASSAIESLKNKHMDITLVEKVENKNSSVQLYKFVQQNLERMNIIGGAKNDISAYE